jgi:hypothetical protein
MQETRRKKAIFTSKGRGCSVLFEQDLKNFLKEKNPGGWSEKYVATVGRMGRTDQI